MNRSQIINTALHAITQDRAATHGNAEDNFGSIAKGWEWWLSARKSGPLTAYDVAMMMVVFKIARCGSNPAHADNSVDLVGYGALAGEIAAGFAANEVNSNGA